METRGVVHLPASLGGINFDKNSQFLAKFEAYCLTGLEFLEHHQSDPLFTKKNLRFN